MGVSDKFQRIYIVLPRYKIVFYQLPTQYQFQNMTSQLGKAFVFILFSSLFSSFYVHSKPTDLSFAIAQKLMIDLRYYCPQQQGDSTKACYKPLTELPPELKEMIRSTAVGGVILFSDNLVNPKQIRKLTQELQQASLTNKYQSPLFISVDQEGGRVVRLPMRYATSFSGNMAIGATYETHKTKFATATGTIIGSELKALGFNINHAPNVDVNVNPNNPVINVRSFSESAQEVAELGYAQLVAMQSQGVIGTLKHFPGHGDTSVDSHTGLPKVEHDVRTIEQVDLKPFKHSIEQGAAKMIMTAHIQYPALDNSTIMNKQGTSMIKPATMSRKILTGTLREQLGFNGVIITDALDMQGISAFFSENDAVIQTFHAGADIALMPIKITKPSDIPKLSGLIEHVKQTVAKGLLSESEILASYRRIKIIKDELELNLSKPKFLASKQHKEIEIALAEASITAIKGTGRIRAQKLHFIMPDPNKCLAITQAMNKQDTHRKLTCSDYLSTSYEQALRAAEQAETIIIGSITPKQSLAEIGGMDDLGRSIKLDRQAKWPKKNRVEQLKSLMAVSKLQNKQLVFVSLRAPYEANSFIDLADDVIATYSYTHTTDSDTHFSGVAYDALAKLFTGKITATGTLPVTIN